MLFKKKKKDLKIQDVSADCPEYTLTEQEKNSDNPEPQGENAGQKARPKKEKRRKMRKIRKKKRNPFLVLLTILAVFVAAGAAFYIWGIPLLGGSTITYVERVSNIMGLGSGNGTLNRYAGIVESQGEWSVSVSGDAGIKEVYVKEGDTVKVGDKLFSYDKEELKLNLDQAKLELEQLENELKAAKTQISGLESQKESASSAEELEIEIQIQSLKANNKKTEYEIKNQKSAIEALEYAADHSDILSELEGVVKKVDSAVVNGEAFGETEFITILAAGDYRVKAMVNEQNQWAIEEGASVIIRSRVDENVTWTGKILTIDTDDVMEADTSSYDESAELTNASRYPFYVQLDSSKGLLLGQHVYVEPDKGQDVKKDGVWLEGYYLVQEEGKTYVWAENRFHFLEKREVTIGEFNEELGQYRILSGLEKDDYVAFPVEGLYPWMRTTKEAEKENESMNSSGNEEEQLKLDDDSFQEFEDKNDNSNKGNESDNRETEDELGPVGYLEQPMEVLL